MKVHKVLIFVLTTLVLLAVLSFVFPKQGVELGELHLKYASLSDFVDPDANQGVDVDQNLADMNSELMANTLRSVYDTLQFYKEFIHSSPLRIHLPNDDYSFFDPVFHQFEQARKKNKVYRVIHYGDSQIEMDRISNILREHLQNTFGGMGVGLIPAIQTVATYSVSQAYSGNLSRFIMFGDSTTQRASHRRYGLMAQFSTVSGNATVSFRNSRSSYAQPLAQNYQKISLLVDKIRPNFKAQLIADTILRVDTVKKDNAALISWTLKNKTNRGRIQLSGQADVYGILLDGPAGVTVDNIPLRGSSGTIFSGIDRSVLENTYSLMNTPLIILQFGGNMMSVINSQTTIDRYMERLSKQFALLKQAAPNARFLFIGPSDMSKRYNGVMKTRKFLPELNQALMKTALANDIAYWDLFHVMGGEDSMVKWVKHSPPYAGSDHIHFTATGAKEIGNLLSRSFMTNYDFYTLRKTINKEVVKTIFEQ